MKYEKISKSFTSFYFLTKFVLSYKKLSKTFKEDPLKSIVEIKSKSYKISTLSDCHQLYISIKNKIDPPFYTIPVLK